MPQRRLLYLDAHQLTAYCWGNGALRVEARFPTGPSGVEGFSGYLGQYPRSIFYLVSDIAEEGFQSESVPYVRGGDRRALLTRKLTQLFYGSPLSVALSQGREKEGRRDERILFAALTRPQSFQPWLASLRKAEARLAGVYSLPLVSPALLHKVAPTFEYCLLVSISRGGIRQSFFQGRHLRFSRLSPIAGSSIHELATASYVESQKIQQYLVGQRLFPHGSALPVLILVHPAQRAAFAERCRSNEDVRFDFIDLHAASRAFALKTELADSFSEQLFLHLIMRQTPPEQFAPPAERRFFRLWQTRFALASVGVLALLGSGLFAGKQYYEVLRQRDEITAALAQAQTDEQRYADMMRGLPQMPASLESLRAVIGRYDTLEKRSTGMEPLLSRIGRAMQEAPRIEVERLDWLLSSNPDDAVELQDVRRSAATPGGAPASAEVFGIAVIHAVLTSPPADQRGVLEAINGFAALLRRDPDLRVTIVRLPFDIESGKLLRGGGEGAPDREPARFVLRVSYKL